MDGRAALVDALGLEPGPALHELELQILRHDPALLPAAPPALRPSIRRPRRRSLVATAAVAIAAATAIVTATIESDHARTPVPIRANTLLELDPASASAEPPQVHFIWPDMKATAQPGGVDRRAAVHTACGQIGRNGIGVGV